MFVLLSLDCPAEMDLYFFLTAN
jgi:hypothetical protein